MLRNNFLNDTGIIDSDGVSYTFGNLELNVILLSNVLKAISAEQVCIYTKSEFQAVSAIKACLNTATNFIVVPFRESFESYTARCSMASIELLISDHYIDDNIITLHPSIGIVTKGGAAADIIGGTEYLEEITLRVESVLNCAELTEIYESDLTLRQSTHLCFHRGACLEGYKFSGFTLDKVRVGIEKAQNLHNIYNGGTSVLFLERIDLLYDIVNGILAPLEKGITVIFADTLSYNTLLHSLNTSAGTLYTSATTIENLLTLLKEDAPDIFKTMGAWVKNQYLKYTIRNYFNSSIRLMMVTGKINRLDLINLLGMPITTLYTMCEVASYVSFETHNKLNADSSVGKVNREHVHVINNNDTRVHGGILVYTHDMAIHTNGSFSEETFFHKFPGRVWTKDVGYVDANDELHVINKTNLVFEEYNGKLIPTGKIIELALSKRFVKKALIVSTSTSKLTLLIEPDTDWAYSKNADLEDLHYLCRELSSTIHRSFNGSYPIEAVLYTEKEGLDDQLYKILIRK